MEKLLCFVAVAIALAGCSKQDGPVVSTQKIDISNVVLITPIGETAKEGDIVQLREIKRDGCLFLGSLKADFSIAVTRAKCGDVIRPASFVLPLNRAHTFMGSDGSMRPGYGSGDKFAVPDYGVDWTKVKAALEDGTLKLPKAE